MTSKDYKLPHNTYSLVYFQNYLLGIESKALLSKTFLTQVLLLTLVEVSMWTPLGQMDQSHSLAYLVTRGIMITLLVWCLETPLNNGITIMQHSRVYSVFSRNKQPRDKSLGILIGLLQIVVSLLAMLIGYQLLCKHSNQATVLYNFFLLLIIGHLDRLGSIPRLEMETE